jgi:hypothetical protein
MKADSVRFETTVKIVKFGNRSCAKESRYTYPFSSRYFCFLFPSFRTFTVHTVAWLSLNPWRERTGCELNVSAFPVAGLPNPVFTIPCFFFSPFCVICILFCFVFFPPRRARERELECQGSASVPMPGTLPGPRCARNPSGANY